MSKMRKGYHHVHIPVALLFAFVVCFMLYKVFVVNDFFGRVVDSVEFVGNSDRTYLVTVIPRKGKEETFYVKGKVTSCLWDSGVACL